jgi:hypothetical protein
MRRLLLDNSTSVVLTWRKSQSRIDASFLRGPVCSCGETPEVETDAYVASPIDAVAVADVNCIECHHFPGPGGYRDIATALGRAFQPDAVREPRRREGQPECGLAGRVTVVSVPVTFPHGNVVGEVNA